MTDDTQRRFLLAIADTVAADRVEEVRLFRPIRQGGQETGAAVVAVEPEESAVLSGRPSGSHKIEGTGIGFVAPLWMPSIANEIQTVSTQEAMQAARRLACEEGIFAGTSTGGNVTVALRVAEVLGPEHTVVTVAVDSGMKYLSTALYSNN